MSSLAKAYASVAAGLHATFPVDPGLPAEMIAVLERIDAAQRLDGKILCSSLVLKKGFWYLATPYAKYHKGHEAAFQEAAALGGRLLANGVYAFTPIAHSHPYATYAPPLIEDHGTHDLWMPFDKQFVDAAFGIIVADMDGWRESKGVTMEVNWAREQGKPLWLMSPDDLSVQPLV